jgi:hypothetical protein
MPTITVKSPEGSTLVLLRGDDVVDADDHRRGLGRALDGLLLDRGRVEDAVLDGVAFLRLGT